MSSPFTAAFLREWRDNVGRSPMTLAKIALATPSSVTLYVATAEVTLSDGTTWESGLSCGSISARIEPVGVGPNPCDCTIQLANRTYSALANAQLDQQVHAYQWQDAEVTLYLWNDVRSANGVQKLVAADLAQVFFGTIDGFSYDDGKLTLNLLQPRAWNKPMPDKRIDKTSYPNCPDGQIGAVPAILYGSWKNFQLPIPYPNPYGVDKRIHEDTGATAGVVPLLLVDPGTGAANVKLLAAGHACAKLFDRDAGHSVFLGTEDILAPIDTPGVSETLGSTESYLTINDDSLTGYYGVRAVDVSANNTALNPRRAMDVFDELSYATVKQATNPLLALKLPNLQSLGAIQGVAIAMSFTGRSTNNAHLRAYGHDVGSGLDSNFLDMVATNVVPNVGWQAPYGNNFWSGEWHFFDSTAHPAGPIELRVAFNGGANNIADIHWVALVVLYTPQRNVVTPAHWVPPVYRKRRKHWYDFITKIGDSLTGVQQPEVGLVRAGVFDIQAVYSVNGQFFANPDGYADDGGGTYSGTAGAIIQRPPDIARHLLVTYGGASSFETGAAAFGSFVRARDLLRNGSPQDFVLAARIAEATTVQQSIKNICEQSLCAITIDRFSGKWLFHVWKQGAPVDYDWPLMREDCADLLECGVNSDVALLQGVRVKYAHDHFRGRTLFESYVNASSSSQGRSQALTRDQRLVVDGTNDRLDWVTGAWGGGPFTYADTLTHATYTAPIDLAADIQAKLRTHISTAAYYTAAGFGHHVKAGFNDALEFYYGASFYNTTIPAGTYDPDAYARIVEATMRAAAGVTTITVAYVQSSNKLNFQSSGSTLGFVSKFSPNCLSPATSAIWTLGFNLGVGSGAASTNLTASYPVYAGRFWMMSEPTATFQLLAFSGANKATGCYGLLGWDEADDTLGNTHFARLARGVRESICATSQGRYGVRSDSEVQAEWIRDELAAQDFRDRIFDLGGVPRAWVRLRTHVCPDMQRMRVIGFDATVDARRPFPRYGSDGSWAGKAFRVLEVVQDLGPSYHTEIYAEEA